MPEIIVKYKSKRTLEALQDFAKYFDYEIALVDAKDAEQSRLELNGVTIISADSSIDTTDLQEIFTGKNISPSELRNNAWQRRK